MASAAPDHSSWARQLKAFAYDVEQATGGDIKVKWYFGGIAGDEVSVIDRITRGQLDGTASGGMLCQRAAPSWRAMRIQGLYRSHEEASFVLSQLTPTLDAEMARAGLVNLSNPILGPDVLFTRKPVHNLEELRHMRLWRWDLDNLGTAISRAIGLTIVPLPLEKAAAAFDDNAIDGFIALPTAALAFQWSARARYLTDLEMAWLGSCMVLSTSSFDKLQFAQQQAVRAAGARMTTRFDEVGERADAALLGGLFGRQGLKVVPASRVLRAEFRAAVDEANARYHDRLVPDALYQRVHKLVDQYRALHAQGGAKGTR